MSELINSTMFVLCMYVTSCSCEIVYAFVCGDFFIGQSSKILYILVSLEIYLMKLKALLCR